VSASIREEVVTTLAGILPMAETPLLSAVPVIHPRVRAAQQGDVTAFEGLYREHVGKIHALCLRMTGDPHEAESATQEAFVRAWKRLPEFRGEAAFGTWLHRVAVNVVLTTRRATLRRLRRVETTDDLERLDRASPSAAPEGARVDLDRAIATLPDGARIVFVLFEIEGYSHAEIARELGIVENTSRAQLHRARHLLREVLDDEA
jgi:RNA polymerase sigma-70 factor, ECF subfamily